MHKSFLLASFLLGASSLVAFASDEQTFTGTTRCGGDEPSRLSLSMLEDGKWRVSVSGGMTRGFLFRDDLSVKGSASDFKSASGFLTSNSDLGGFTAKQSADGSQLTVGWLDKDGAPSTLCQAGKLQRAERPAKEQFEALLAALSNQSPTLEDAQKVVTLDAMLPDEVALAELDRQSALDRVRESSNAFWTAFWTTEAKRLRDMPAKTAEDIAALEARVAAATAMGMGPDGLPTETSLIGLLQDGISSAGDFTLYAATRVADSKAHIGTEPQPMRFGGSLDRCDRITLAGTAGSARELEMQFAFPMDYWSAESVAVMRKELETCAGTTTESLRSRYSQLVSLLDGSKSEWEARAANRVWAQQQLVRLTAVGPSIAVLKDLAEVRSAALQTRQMSETEFKRFLGTALGAQEETLLANLGPELEKLFAAAVPGEESEKKVLSLCTMWEGRPAAFNEACATQTKAYAKRLANIMMEKALATIAAGPHTLDDLRAKNWYDIDVSRLPVYNDPYIPLADELYQARDSFAAKVAPYLDKALQDYRVQMLAAFEAAPELGSDAQYKVSDQCQNLATEAANKSAQTGRAIGTLCLDVQREAEKKQEVARCEKAIVTSGATPEQLSARFKIVSLSKESFATGHDLLCGFTRMRMTPQVTDNSGLFSSGLLVTANMGQGQPLVITFEEAKDEAGPYWKAQEITGLAQAQGAAAEAQFGEMMDWSLKK